MAQFEENDDFELIAEKNMSADDGDDVTLSCLLSPKTSTTPITVRWFKYNMCILLYQNGQVIEAPGYEDKLSFSTGELCSGKLSLVLKSFNTTDSGFYYCQVVCGRQEKVVSFLLRPSKFKKIQDVGKLLKSLEIPEMQKARLKSADLLEAKLKVKYKHFEEVAKLQLEQSKNQYGILEVKYKKLLDALAEKEMQLREKDRLLEERSRQLDEKDKQLTIMKKELDDANAKNIKMEGEGSSERHQKPPLKRKRSGSMNILPPLMAEGSPRTEFSASPSMSPLALALLGGTEAWRRAVGFTIMGREHETKTSPAELTMDTSRTKMEVWGRQLVLLDPPDCPGLSAEEMRQEEAGLSDLGCQAFLLVVPVVPPEERQRRMMEKVEIMFGKDCWKRAIVLFAHADALKECSIEEFLQRESQELQQLVEKCGNRYHVLNVMDRAHHPQVQVQELLSKIEELVAGKTESFYVTQTSTKTGVQGITGE